MRFWRAALLSVAAGAALSFFGLFPFVGLPGALSLPLAEPFVRGLYGTSEFPRDSAWPWAILTTVALGPVVPAAVLLPWRLSGGRYALAVAALLLAGFALVPTLVYALGVAPLLAPGSAS